MNLRQLFSRSEPVWDACIDHFGQHGLVLPGLPQSFDELLRSELREENAGRFSTGSWRGGRHWDGRIDDWVAHPQPTRAWFGLHHDIGGRVAEVCLVTPLAGVFMRHPWSGEHPGVALSLRVHGAYRLAAQVLSRTTWIEKQGCWPEHQRLLVIDDAFDLPRWGWLAASAQARHSPATEARITRASQVMYLDVMSALDARCSMPADLQSA